MAIGELFRLLRAVRSGQEKWRFGQAIFTRLIKTGRSRALTRRWSVILAVTPLGDSQLRRGASQPRRAGSAVFGHRSDAETERPNNARSSSVP